MRPRRAPTDGMRETRRRRMAPFVTAIAETLASPPAGLSADQLLAMREELWRSEDSAQLALPMPPSGTSS